MGLKSHHLRAKAMNGTAGEGVGAGEQGGQHFSERKTLNKQEINIQHFYKLQHYETVGHITQKKNLQYVQSSILKKFSKNSDLYSFTLYKILQEREREHNCTQTFGSVGK